VKAIAYRRRVWSRLWTKWWIGGWRSSSICAGPDAAHRCCSTRAVRYSTANWANILCGALRIIAGARGAGMNPPGSFRSQYSAHLSEKAHFALYGLSPVQNITSGVDQLRIPGHPLRASAPKLRQSLFKRSSVHALSVARQRGFEWRSPLSEWK
jgi:hypothetical protein